MKRMDVIRSSLADQDLVEIWRYVAKDSFDVADKLLRRFDARIEALRTNPESGEKVVPSKAGLRRVVEGNYLIFYQIRDDSLHIVRVLHAARKWEDLL